MKDVLTKNHPMSPNGQDSISKNNSNNLTLEEITETRVSRRTLIKGGLAVVAGSFFGMNLTGCGSSRNNTLSPVASTALLDFDSVAKNIDDMVTVPEGYSVQVLYRLGDPINSFTSEYSNDGSDTDFNYRAGDHHDGMAYFGMNKEGTFKDLSNSSRGLLCMNHENMTQIFMHTEDQRAAYDKTARPSPEIDKEVSAHGVSVIEIQKGNTEFSINKNSVFNKRITAQTEININGPVKNHDLVKTKYSTTGDKTRGTLNNCANGLTPWGTYLTCEENWAGYFKRPESSILIDIKAQATQNRYMGSSASDGSYGWANSTTNNDLYDRWDITPKGSDQIEDYRNAANTFGWVVEIDPFNPTSTPRKRTAFGRMGHEGAMPGLIKNGEPLVYYMGDDSKGEYIYKYVSTLNWDESDLNGGLDVGDKYLDDGKLFVAKFNDDGSGEWLELSMNNTDVTSYASYSFDDLGDILVNTRHAADAVKATPMDRPEWTGVHPNTGDIYITLTNNTNRGKASGVSSELDASNPRYYTDDKDGKTSKGNVNGHLIRMQEVGNSSSATAFNWDIYLFGAQADANENINISKLTDDNDFSSPDGLYFSQASKGLMWLQTDDGYYTDVTNCMMLAALPGKYNDGKTTKIINKSVPSNSNVDETITTYVGAEASNTNLKRFLVGPKECEITGITETPDGKAIFVNIQHPGEKTKDLSDTTSYGSHWPDASSSRPRSATIVITKDDGGIVGS
ncbi:PhoX family phosphatase [Poseidonibacter sp. 1_MG-2023]|uniref:PhoX family protein n=1 Tax=Poseidonibacter TaxID=2321187 RepID=UPI001E615B15|nr:MULTISPECIES: PhoX family phosphatase [Poseidonibacter]MDO6828754.1 PhoX family phosphatase [Poseidonibacter sp. 1_MG-2023]